MADKIKLVQGDTRPYVRVALKDLDGIPIDVSTATVRFKFRAAGSTTTLFVEDCSKPQGGTDGVVLFNFPPGSLSVPPGPYEGEIEIAYSATDIQTVYDLLKFSVRAQFS
jgi:hypothetical protein